MTVVSASYQQETKFMCTGGWGGCSADCSCINQDNNLHSLQMIQAEPLKSSIETLYLVKVCGASWLELGSLKGSQRSNSQTQSAHFVPLFFAKTSEVSWKASYSHQSLVAAQHMLFTQVFLHYSSSPALKEKKKCIYFVCRWTFFFVWSLYL